MIAPLKRLLRSASVWAEPLVGAFGPGGAGGGCITGRAVKLVHVCIKDKSSMGMCISSCVSQRVHGTLDQLDEERRSGVQPVSNVSEHAGE